MIMSTFIALIVVIVTLGHTYAHTLVKYMHVGHTGSVKTRMCVAKTKRFKAPLDKSDAR